MSGIEVRRRGASGTSGAAAMPAHTIAAIGDSITAQCGDAGTEANPKPAPSYVSAEGYIYWANSRLGGRLDWVYNGGVGGNTSAQILSRMGEITSLDPRPGYCIVEEGGTPSLGSIADLPAACDILIDAGITPILTTVLPSINNPNIHGTINQALKEYASQTPGVLLCDWYPYVADPATGTWAAGMSDDGTHPNVAGASRMGEALATVLDTVVAPRDPLTGSNAMAEDVLTNGLFVGSAGSLGESVGAIADGWTSRFGANATLAKVPRSDGKQGDWQQVTYAAPGNSSGNMYTSLSLVAGGIYIAQVEYELDVTLPASITDLAIYLGTSGPGMRANAGRIGDSPLPSSPYTRFPARGVLRTSPTLMSVNESTPLQVKFGATGTAVARFARASLIKLN